MKAFCVGLPGWMNSSFTACIFAHSASASEINYAQHDRIATVCRDPVENTNHSLSWQIQIDVNRQRLT